MELTAAHVMAATAGHLVQGEAHTPLTGVSTDSRTVAPGELFVAIEGERLDGHRFVGRALGAGAAAAVVRRWPLEVATDRPVIVVDDTVAAYGQVASWWVGQMPARIVTVTGSNGKTTVKEMIAHLLDGLGPTVRSLGNHNNHIGVPETLLRVGPGHRFAVVEMGTNHPGELEALARLVRSSVAVITNIGPSHLEAFGSERGVAREKERLLAHLAPDGLAVLHADDKWSRWIALRHQGRLATFGVSPDAAWRAEAQWLDDDQVRFHLAGTGVSFAVPVVGSWQVGNTLAALAAAAELGLDPRAAAQRLASFRPPRWRMTVQRVGGLTLVLDCYNANPASMAAAIRDVARRAAAGRRVAVVGDMLELGRVSHAAHTDVGRLVASEGYDVLCAVGAQAEVVAGAACRQGMAPGRVFWATDREVAAQWLCARVGPEDTVLFKASRGVRLEQVAAKVESWAAAHLRAGAQPAVAT